MIMYNLELGIILINIFMKMKLKAAMQLSKHYDARYYQQYFFVHIVNISIMISKKVIQFRLGKKLGSSRKFEVRTILRGSKFCFSG